uniref:cGMP-dependent protein kinase n=2 Tax=Alexandrium andersonii TaxID=327968 RepID=A0A7S2CR63_9DINO|mmetsp:Transcript_42266/g.95965  ORF Transcript_42266/g.95965 Transcript_42266/m.95965 type:complete len:781 (+) Transcript_42266:1-2343(+)
MGCGGSVNKYAPESSPQEKEILSFLSKVPLFRQLPEDQLPLLAQACEIRDYMPKQVVIKQGDIGKEFFIIRCGEASVHIADPAVGDGTVVSLKSTATSANLKKGDYFGEKALVHDVPRSASIIAETILSTLEITRVKFRELGLNEKFHFNRRNKAVGTKAQRAKPKEPTKKSAAERLFVTQALKQNENLQVMVSLDTERLNHMIETCWKETIQPGKTVISEDDATADYFYVVQDGMFKVTVKGKDGEIEPKSVKTLGPGSSFGEMALLCMAPRSATVTATTEAIIWVFDRDNFRNILMKNTHAQIKLQMDYLDNVEILKCLLPSERRSVAEAFLELHYERGECIIEQGQVGTAFYVLFEGEVSVIQDGNEINTLVGSMEDKKAPFFGEMALLNDEPRTATVKVVSSVAKVLVLDRESFDMLLGPLEDLIKESQTEHGREGKDTMTRKSSKAASKAKAKTPIFRDELTHIGLLGCGGFGTVDFYEHSKTQQLYALKSMSKGYIVQTEMQGCVMNEKEILWMCDSPFIIRLYATYNTPQNLQLLLEVAHGGDLHIAYQRKGLYGSKTHAVFYTAGVACAFQHLHGLKVVYRDLKPENVLVNADGHVKLTDMGLAKVCLGKTYTVCGTPDYFAPEMIKQSGHSFSLDWWTLGVFLFELLAGDPPFEAPDPMQVYRNVCQGIGKIQFPPSCMSAASSLIRGLLVEEPLKRLPMLSGGMANLERHDFYAGLKWDDFRALRVDPPYKPTLSGPKDRRNFRANPNDAPPQVDYKDDGSGWDLDFVCQ